jgi:hypothetical protein
MSARAKLAVETDECAAARHVHGQQDVTLEGHEIARAYAHYNCPQLQRHRQSKKVYAICKHAVGFLLDDSTGML